ncbi:MAG: low molecular weight phosphotyrosine protein phosphatase [Nocardioidaceae bacterium]|nr:low molecular weight phosphotyrosine protein phosphatase [Nocardioidaceae bacterium]
MPHSTGTDVAATAPELPRPLPGGGSYRIALVCLGNICRSPMAQVVLTHRIAGAGLADAVRLTSAGTGSWHLGHPMDQRAADTLSRVGLDPSSHRARQFDAAWFADSDLVLAMDRANRDELAGLAPPERRHRLMLLRAFDPEGGPDSEVPDPWYGGPDGFDEVLAIIERTAETLTAALRHELG